VPTISATVTDNGKFTVRPRLSRDVVAGNQTSMARDGGTGRIRRTGQIDDSPAVPG
jgi:hypothetical protein